MDQIQIDMQIDIQEQLDSAIPSSTIKLPDDILNFPLIISKPCTVMGFEHTEINVTEEDVAIAVQILSDGVIFTDVKIKNKVEAGYTGIYVEDKKIEKDGVMTNVGISLERLSIESNIGLSLNLCDTVEIIETKVFNASVGFKIFNSMNVDINACDAYNNNIGLDIIGDSSVKGDVESYQGFGLNVDGDDLAGLIMEDTYEFIVDGIIFSFAATVDMSYNKIVTEMNAMVGFNPIYTAEFSNGDIIIKTANSQLLVEKVNTSKCLLNSLSVTPLDSTNNYQYSYSTFGLDITPDESTPLGRNMLLTFIVGSDEVQFFSTETDDDNDNSTDADGTTYQELVDLMNIRLVAMGCKAFIIDNDIRVERAKTLVENDDNELDLFDALGSTPQTSSVNYIGLFGLSDVDSNDTETPLIENKKYAFYVDNVKVSTYFENDYNKNYITYHNLKSKLQELLPDYIVDLSINDNIIYTLAGGNDLIIQRKSGEYINFYKTFDLIDKLNVTPTYETDNGNMYTSFNLDFSSKDDILTQLNKSDYYRFKMDGIPYEINFTNVLGEITCEELAIKLVSVIPNFYEIKLIDDLTIHNNILLNLKSGTRFKDLFNELDIVGKQSFNKITESYQNFGLNVLENDTTPLTIGQYVLMINNINYTFNIVAPLSYGELVLLINESANFSANYIAKFKDGDIIITASINWIKLKAKNINLIELFGITPLAAVTGSEETRKDRSHNINVIGSLFHENVIGVRVMNSNDITLLSNTKIFFNTNIGIWQMPSSYNVKFRGEIYENGNYGIRNTDKTGGPHEVDAMDSWWGDLTGPSMFGTGEGDKISANVLWQPQRQTGTVPDLSYPKTRDFILGALGYPVVKVELTDEQIAMCIDKAIEKYMQYRTPEPTQRYIALGAGSDSYFLPLDIPKEEIIEVTYSPNADIFAQLSGSGESFMMTYYMNGAGSSFLSDFYVAMAYKETMESVLGIGAAYELLSAKNTDGEWQDAIRLSPRPDGNVSLGLLVSRPLTEEEVDSIEWIHKYALAWAKEFLGRIRSKFGSVPGPTGEMQLDGPTLLGEAQQEKLALEESVMLRGTPLGFIVG